MPTIYLSPSTQPYNLYATGGSEQDYMNRLADELEPYLTAAGLSYVRKRIGMTAAEAIAASNAGDFDLHLGLHSNAAPEDLAGKMRGILVFYNPASSESKKVATLIADQLRLIYPLPDAVRIEPSTSIGEVTRVTAPPAYLEIGYHDNPEDAKWITDSIPFIAASIAKALAGYFQTPFLMPTETIPGVVRTDWGSLNIRERPSLSAPIIAKAENGTPVVIINRYLDWYLIRLGTLLGYASAAYITPMPPYVMP